MKLLTLLALSSVLSTSMALASQGDKGHHDALAMVDHHTTHVSIVDRHKPVVVGHHKEKLPLLEIAVGELSLNQYQMNDMFSSHH